jgi:hypothetical protein
LILKRGFASNLWKHQENQSNLRNTGGSKRKRDKTNLEIGLGLLLKFKAKKNKANESHN